MKIIDSFAPFLGDKYTNSAVEDVKLLHLNKLDTDDESVDEYSGRMTMTVVTPAGIALPMSFNILVEVEGEDWSIAADNYPEIQLSGGYKADNSLNDIATYEINNLLCLSEIVMQFDSFRYEVEEAVGIER